MNGVLNEWVLFGTAFLASAVEAVEALTIVLAVGVTRSWNVALRGTALALIVLATIVAVFGPLLRTIPLGTLQLVIGIFLVLFGLSWLRKAILRYSGRKALRDENAAYDREARAFDGMSGRNADRLAFATAFNAVLLEGLEVVVIVVTFGAASTSALASATLGALAAIVVVAIAGVLLRRPAARVPENLMKFIVGLMLTSLGTYWAGEGLSLQWWRQDSSIILLIAFYTLLSGTIILRARRTTQALAR
jgi:uncharacterized membrane protein